MKFKIDYVSSREPNDIEGVKLEKIRERFSIGPRDNGFACWLKNEKGELIQIEPIEGSVVKDGKNYYGEDLYSAEFEYYEWIVEINSLEDLLRLKETCGHSLMISNGDEMDEITIVDDYMC